MAKTAFISKHCFQILIVIAVVFIIIFCSIKHFIIMHRSLMLFCWNEKSLIAWNCNINYSKSVCFLAFVFYFTTLIDLLTVIFLSHWFDWFKRFNENTVIVYYLVIWIFVMYHLTCVDMYLFLGWSVRWYSNSCLCLHLRQALITLLGKVFFIFVEVFYINFLRV